MDLGPVGVELMSTNTPMNTGILTVMMIVTMTRIIRTAEIAIVNTAMDILIHMNINQKITTTMTTMTMTTMTMMMTMTMTMMTMMAMMMIERRH